MRLSTWCVVLLLAGPGHGRAQSTGPSADGAYLRPGDLLRVSIWQGQEKNISAEFQIDESGVVTLPLLGAREVTHQSVGDLRKSIIAQYASHFREPAVEIVPLRRVFLLGEVVRPGLYAIDPTLSYAGAIAMAGGATINGDPSRVRLVRADGGIVEQVDFRSARSLGPVQSGDQIYVEPRSWFARNGSVVISAVISLTSVLANILLFKL